jgi:preprotein translocase subunit SecB
MTDTTANTPSPDAAQQPGGPHFRVLAQYVRDFSFENPRAPESLRVEGKPAIDLGVEINAQGRADGLFEVDLKLSIKATSEETPLFQIELLYGGLFQLANISEADIEPLLMIECPRYLFPYARQMITTATADGGFYPPFMLEPLDFAAIYAARKAQNGVPQGQA